MEEPSMSADDIAKAEHSRHAKKISDREQAKRTAEMKDKLEERKAQRLVEKQLKNTKALGAVVNESDDDLLAWMEKHKAIKPDEPASQGDHIDKRRQNKKEQDKDIPDVAIKSSAVDLHDAESRILTLADATILGEDGRIAEEGDVLEDAGRSRAEVMARKKQAAQKQGLHFEEDSKRLGMLSKYDEQEGEALVSVSKDGTLDDEDVRASIAARLRASAGAIPGRGGAASGGAVAAAAAAATAAAAAAAPPDAAREYMHASEAGAFREKRGKKRKAGKSRKVRFEDDDEEGGARGAADAAAAEGGKGGASVFDELEASGAGSEGATDRGSRAAKRQREAEAAAADVAEEQQKASRYELALDKANQAASTSAQRASVATGHISEDEDEEDKLMARDLAKEGKALEAAVLDEVAAELAAPASEKDPKDEMAGKWHTTDTKAFIDSLNNLEAAKAEDQAMQDAADAAKHEDAQPEPMDEDEPVAPKPPPRRAPRSREGGWEEDPVAAAELAAAETLQNASAEGDEKTTTADGPKAPKRRMRGRRGGEEEVSAREGGAGKRGRGGDVEMKGPEGSEGIKEEEEEKGTMLFELQKGLGRGLAEALVIVRERGWLNEVEYRGRISDFKHNQRDLVEDALLSDSTALAHRVGASLQRKDEYGRILTPKEVFRDVSYAFHGYKRAASKKEKNLKSLQNSRAQAGLLDDTNIPYHMSVNPSQLLDDWKARKWRPKWTNYGKNAKDNKKSAGRKGGLTDSHREGVSAALDGSSKKEEKPEKAKEEESHGWAAEVLESSSVAELPARSGASGSHRSGGGGGDRGAEGSRKNADKETVLPPPPPPME